MRIGSADIVVWTTHQLAGTALAVALSGVLDGHRSARWLLPEEGVDLNIVSIVIVLAHLEQATTVPRLLHTAVQDNRKVILVHDENSDVPGLVDSAQALGVWSVVDIRDDMAGLATAVNSALAGKGRPLDVYHAGWARALEGEPVSLTQREQEVAQTLFGIEGTTPQDVAKALGISVNTVRVHLSNIRRKLSGRYTGNTDALRTALIERGWID